MTTWRPTSTEAPPITTTITHRTDRPSGTGRRTRSKPPIQDEQALYDYAVASLSRGMRTVAQLRRILGRRVISGPEGTQLISAVVARLQSHQYLSDTRYAAAFSTLRKEGQRLGARRVAQDLRSRGVPADIITREGEAAYADTDELTQARAFLSRKRVAAPTPGDQRTRARIFRMLARAGFSPGTSIQVLRSWGGSSDACDPAQAGAWDSAPSDEGDAD